MWPYLSIKLFNWIQNWTQFTLIRTEVRLLTSNYHWTMKSVCLPISNIQSHKVNNLPNNDVSQSMFPGIDFLFQWNLCFNLKEERKRWNSNVLTVVIYRIFCASSNNVFFTFTVLVLTMTTGNNYLVWFNWNQEIKIFWMPKRWWWLNCMTDGNLYKEM